MSDEWEALARDGRLQDAIVAYVDRHDWVTFPELQHALARVGIETHGDYRLSLAKGTVVLWVGMSEAFTAAVDAALLAKRIELQSASVLCYLIDGGFLQMPLAKRPPKGGYRVPHWAPSTMRTPERIAQDKRVRRRA